MEKFAIDLDKVLDDFELQEDQAEQIFKCSEKIEESDSYCKQNFSPGYSPSYSPTVNAILQTNPNTEAYQNLDEQNHYIPNADKPKSVDEGLEYSEDVNNADSATSSLHEEHSKEDLLVDFGDTPLIDSVKETSANPPANGHSSSLLDQMLLGDFSAEPTLLDLAGDSSVLSSCDASPEFVKETSAIPSENENSSLLLDQILTGAFSAEPTLLDLPADASSEDKDLENYLDQLENEDDGEVEETVDLIQEKCDEEKSLLNGLIKEDISEESENVNHDVDVIVGTSSIDEACDSNDLQSNTEKCIPNSEDVNCEAIEESAEVDSDVISETETDAVSETETAGRSLDSDAASETETTERSLDGESPIQSEISQTSHNEQGIEDVQQPRPVEGAESLQAAEPYSSLTDDERALGIVKPIWIPDEEALQCMDCNQRFTVLRRRHHCRACGRLLCGNCCSSRARLEYMENKESRVCLPCLQVLKKVEAYQKWGRTAEEEQQAAASGGADVASQSSMDSTPASSPSPCSPLIRVNPNNPAEYCSTVPPPLQAAGVAALPPPTVMVPVGVLKKEGTSSQSRGRNEPKQVIFSDGIRPGGDLAELDSWRVPANESSSSSGHRSVPRRVCKPVVVVTSPADASASGGGEKKRQSRTVTPELPPVLGNISTVEQLCQTLADPDAAPVVFALIPSQTSGQTNGLEPHVLQVRVKLLYLDCCVRRKCWSFSTFGMRWVAQDEMVILLEQESLPAPSASAGEAEQLESLPPADVFYHLLSIYEEALNKHQVIVNLGHTVTPGTFLGSTEHGGFLFIRTSFQCVQKVSLPPPPYLVGILLQRWEIPWAKVFPLRLLLRLGAEFRYYPCPLYSVRKRKSVFGEVGHTIINLLADMRNFNYSLPAVPGLVVHMEERETNILLPRSRYQQVCKALAQSNDHVISLAASFSPAADAHLVCLQLDDGSYQTQAINIHTKPRKVTGASFLVLNGALKSSSGLSGRSSMVEDGVMVQLLPDTLAALKQALVRMENFVIVCGKVSAEQPEETVTLKWVDQEPSPINLGVVSPIDGRSLTGVSSIRVMQPRDYKGQGRRLLRWTELFLLHTDESGRKTVTEDSSCDVTRFAETVAKAAAMALAVKLDSLDPHTLVGLRFTLDGDTVEYIAGAEQKSLARPCIEELDSSLIPLLHRESAAQSVPCITELWFQITHP